LEEEEALGTGADKGLFNKLLDYHWGLEAGCIVFVFAFLSVLSSVSKD